MKRTIWHKIRAAAGLFLLLSACQVWSTEKIPLRVMKLPDPRSMYPENRVQLALIREYDKVLCLNLIENAEKQKQESEAPAQDAELTQKIEEMIEARRAAKQAKNYAEADRIRAELSAMGVTLIDTKEGTTYRLEG